MFRSKYSYLRPPFLFLVSFGFSFVGTGAAADVVGTLLTVYPPSLSGTMSTCTPWSSLLLELLVSTLLKPLP